VPEEVDDTTPNTPTASVLSEAVSPLTPGFVPLESLCKPTMPVPEFELPSTPVPETELPHTAIPEGAVPDTPIPFKFVPLNSPLTAAEL
jgi:hypothetical protein